MDSMVHYTSLKNWREIQRTGFLLPKTPTVNLPESITPWSSYFIVGLPHHLHEGWVNSGLMWELVKHTLGAEVALQISIINKAGAFVREHEHVSPARLKEVGINFYSCNPLDRRVQKAYDLYFESAVPLADYDGSYRIPEVWVPQAISSPTIEPLLFPDLTGAWSNEHNADRYKILFQ